MMTNKTIDVGFKKKVQPVRIGGIDLEMKLGEKYRKQYMSVLPEMENKLSEQGKIIKKATEENDYEALNNAMENVKTIVRDCVDLVFGEGAFGKLYEAADEDVDAVFEAFGEVMAEFKKLQDKKKMQTYIDGKKGKG